MVLLSPSAYPISEPPTDCGLCPRLAAFRRENREKFPDWFNAPVPGFGDPGGRLLIVGLAPGLKGANRTGRPFTGDYAGDLLFATLRKFGFASGTYGADPGDGLTLRDAYIVNAVRCVPPANKPTGEEKRNCRPYLADNLQAFRGVRLLLALGRVAHEAVVTVTGGRQVDFKFGHAAVHQLVGDRLLVDSYHCSRYNTNTGRLTVEMFDQVFELISDRLHGTSA